MSESGSGLLIVTAFTDRWGTEPYPPIDKTVRAESIPSISGPYNCA
jgi:hypothetical protein